MSPEALHIFERPREGIAAALRQWLARHPAAGTAEGTLIVLSPGWAAQPEPAEAAPGSILLLPGSAGALLEQFRPRCAVSYGSGGRDSLTISSIEGERLSIAVQRELPTLYGGVVEQQELVLPARHDWSPLPALAVVGGLLLLGAAPDQLMADPPT